MLQYVTIAVQKVRYKHYNSLKQVIFKCRFPTICVHTIIPQSGAMRRKIMSKYHFPERENLFIEIRQFEWNFVHLSHTSEESLDLLFC